MVLSGLGLIAFVLVPNGDRANDAALSVGDGIDLPLVLDGDRLGLSSLDGNPPVALTGPGDFTGVRYESSGRLLYVQRAGKDAGFYRMEGGEPRLVIPLSSHRYVSRAEWSRDGSRAAWIEPRNDTYVLLVAEPGQEARALGPEGLHDFRWSPDGEAILAWEYGEPSRSYVIHTSGVTVPIAMDDVVGVGWLSVDEAVVLHDAHDGPDRDVVIVDQDGERVRVLGRAYVKMGGLPPAFAFSPDGRWLAWGPARAEAGEHLGLVVAGTDGSGIVTPRYPAQLRGVGSGQAHPAWSPDGRYLAWDRGGSVLVAETGVWEARVVAQGEMPMWSLDGSRIAFVRSGEDRDTVYVVRADGSGDEAKVVEIADARGLAGLTAWSPDGGRLVVPLEADDSARILSLDLRAGELEDLPVPMGDSPWPVLAPDGSAFAYLTGTQLHLVTPEGDERVLNAPASLPRDWAEDGTAMLFVQSGVINTLNLETGRLERLLTGGGMAQDAVWSSDRSRVAFLGDRRLGVLDVATGESRVIVADLNAIPLPTTLGPGHLRWSTDDKRIAFFALRSTEPFRQDLSDPIVDVCVVDANGADLRRLDGSPGYKSWPLWAPDDRHLAYVSRGDQLGVVNTESGEELALHTDASFGHRWVSSEQILVGNRDGIALVGLDGAVEPLVASTTHCNHRLLGWADGKLFFTSTCSHARGV